jgi:alpha-1,2-mannosyltransferase
MTPQQSARRSRLVAVSILAVVGAYVLFGLESGSWTLGCDYLTYADAAQRWLHGLPIYDLSVTTTGACGVYQYPPPFLLLVTPFSLLGPAKGFAVWVGLLTACWAVGVALLPVRPGIRWLVLLFSGIGWPLIYSLRIGQVTPLLFLILVCAWRAIDRPVPFGVTVALGSLMKLQPGLFAVWLLVRRQWAALIVSIVSTTLAVVIAGALGLGDWIGLLTLLRSLTVAVAVPANLAVGATTFFLGVGPEVAGTIQAANTIVILVAVVVAGKVFRRDVSFLTTLVCTQLISPIIWSHYALLLLIPVAWLLDRGAWWALVIPAGEAWVLLPFLPNWTYTLAFYLILAALFVIGWRTRTTPRTTIVEPLVGAPKVGTPA